MKQFTLIGCLVFISFGSFAQTKPSLKLKAFERYFISGKIPITKTVEMGGKETKIAPKKSEPEYFLYLIVNKVPYIKIERVWIKQQLYTATINKITEKPVLLKNGPITDTLIKYTDEAVWQIVLTGKESTNIKPKKDIAKLVAENQLVLRLIDKNAKTYTRSVKAITKLAAARGM